MENYAVNFFTVENGRAGFTLDQQPPIPTINSTGQSIFSLNKSYQVLHDCVFR